MGRSGLDLQEKKKTTTQAMSVLFSIPQYHFCNESRKWIEFSKEKPNSPLHFELLQLNVLFDERKGKKYFPNICFSEIRYKHIIETLFFPKSRESKDLEKNRHFVICCNESTTNFVNLLKENKFCRETAYLSNINGFGAHFGNMIISSFPLTLYSLDMFKSAGLWRKGVIGILSTKEDQEEEEGEGEYEDKEENVTNLLAICNIHTTAKDKGPKRKKQLEEIYRLFEEHNILKESENILIVGDLNLMYDQEDKSIHSGYIDIWKYLYGEKEGYTFDSSVNLMHREIWPLGRVVGYDMRSLKWRLDRWLLKNKKGKENKFVTEIEEMEIFANEPIFDPKKKRRKSSLSGNSLFCDIVESFSDYFFQKSVFRSEKEDYLFPSDHFGLKGWISIKKNL